MVKVIQAHHTVYS